MFDDDTLTGDSKSDFSLIYDRPDPRDYYRALMPLEYQIPQQALPVFESVLAASERDGRPRTVVDVCCSYGINAALLRTGVDLADIGKRGTDPAREELSAAEVIADDKTFYANRLRHPARRVLGLDISAPAIDYGVQTGLLAGGWAEDLESNDPSPALAEGLRDVGLVACTGGVGYIGRSTFRRILASVAEPEDLWLAVFVLRVFPYDDIADMLGEHGLVTERWPGTFAQRRFADQGEFDAANHDVAARGLDPTGKEAEGWYYADCYLTRPAAAVAATPLADLVI